MGQAEDEGQTLMPIDEFKFAYISEDDSKEIATRQLLSFLSVNEEERKKRAPSKALFSLSKIPPGAMTDACPFFKWESRRIYDVDGFLLFWDQSIKLDDTNSLTVRTAGTDLLRTPVWSVSAGKTEPLDALICAARELLHDFPDIKPVLMNDETEPRLICYSYPRLGILASSVAQPNERFVIDLWRLEPIPVKKKEHEDDEPREESVTTVWSPYDFVTRATVDRFRALFRRQRSGLPRMPATLEQISPAAAAARDGIEEMTTGPELEKIGQETSYFCAPATMEMILRRHGVMKDQYAIAPVMKTDNDGTDPVDQADAVDNLTGYVFVGSLDSTTSFTEGKDEIRANRPFKIGSVAHSRACCGFMVESGGREWLYIYDPWPPFDGKVYFESWLADYLRDYVYVRPATSM